jgi:hypothetical protein
VEHGLGRYASFLDPHSRVDGLLREPTVGGMAIAGLAAEWGRSELHCRRTWAVVAAGPPMYPVIDEPSRDCPMPATAGGLLADSGPVAAEHIQR